MTNRFPKEKFEQVAAENGYEVFTPDQIASYYKEGIEKSMNDKMSEAEKKEFVADCMSLAKVILVDKDGSESTVYFRKSQVDWEKAEDGTIMKGVAGVYADTPANRLLGRVGEAYIPDADFMKSLDSEENEIAKAARTGRYADTPENHRLYRVGQPYKKREGKGGAEGDDKKSAGKGEKKGGLDEKTLKDAWASIRTVDDEGTWDDALREHLGDDAADSVYNEDGDLNPKKMFSLIKKLPADVVKRCIKEVGVEPEDGDQPMPGEGKTGNDKKMDRAVAKERGGMQKGEKKIPTVDQMKKHNPSPERLKEIVADAKAAAKEFRESNAPGASWSADHYDKIAEYAQKMLDGGSEGGNDKKLPEGWKKSIRVVDDEDSWNAALEDAMGSKEYNKVFTEDLAQDEDKWFKKMEEIVPKFMSPKQVQILIDEVGTETEDDD